MGYLYVMKIKLTEQQFRRVILKEQLMPGITFFESDPIEELGIVQPGKDIIEKGLAYIGKAIGIVDIIVRGGFQQVKKDIEELVKAGKLNLEKPLKKITLVAHATSRRTGCGQFSFGSGMSDGDESYKFLQFLSQFTNSNTKVFIGGCHSGSNPRFLNTMATALGVNEIVAPTGFYNPATNLSWDKEFPYLGEFITCKGGEIPPSPNEGYTSNLWSTETHGSYTIFTDEEKKHMMSILKRTDGKGHDELKKYKKERMKEKMKNLGCTFSTTNPYGR